MQEFKKKIHGSGTTLIISDEEMNDILRTFQALEYSNILLNGVTKTIKNETKEQKGGFLGMLLDTLGASLLGNMLTGKRILRAGYGNKQGKGTLRAGNGYKEWIFHPILKQILKYKSIIRMNLDLMEFIIEIICLKDKG